MNIIRYVHVLIHTIDKIALFHRIDVRRMPQESSSGFGESQNVQTMNGLLEVSLKFNFVFRLSKLFPFFNGNSFSIRSNFLRKPNT